MIPKYCHRILLIQQQILRKRQWVQAIAIEIKALPRETYVQEHAKMIEIKRATTWRTKCLIYPLFLPCFGVADYKICVQIPFKMFHSLLEVL